METMNDNLMPVHYDDLSNDAFKLRSDEIMPWYQMPDEPDDWYHIFCTHYMLRRGHRTIRSAYESYCAEQGEETSSSVPSKWYQMASDYDWVDRARAHDRQATMQDFEVWEERRRRLREDEWATASSLMNIAINKLEQFTSQMETLTSKNDGTPTVVGVKITDVPGIVNAASKLGRMASEMVTSANLHIVARHQDIEAIRQKRWDQIGGKLSKLRDPDDSDIIEGEVVD